MAKITVYTTSHCPYCVQAKSLLKSRGIPFEEIQLSEEDDQAWGDLAKRSKMQTVPQIFADDRIIGGFTELAALDRQDKLESLKN